ncbi:hypothetical protein ACH3VR_05835 [Microbacterium sp. B2969]|uniref:Uncharacterized protein n=1 Tax=Microbacterium alkaliflavum TaxID=3248839 RepID=A0ABW7Q4V7_9MICO
MHDKTDSGHWFHRVATEVQDWLNANPSTPLSTEAFDAVVGAGGAPEQRGGADYLSDADEEYVAEQRRAREAGD